MSSREKDNWRARRFFSNYLVRQRDESLPPLPAASDKELYSNSSDQQQFNECCNEFWRGILCMYLRLCRNELFYAVTHLYEYCQQELLRLLSWQASLEPEPISVGNNLSIEKLCHS